MPYGDYIPGDDQSFALWAESLARCIAGEPEKYRFSPEDAAALAAAVRNFSRAFEHASNPTTRTQPAIRCKNDARKTCEATCRRFAMAIKNHPAISDSDKVSAGVRPMERRRERIEQPRTRPLLKMIGMTPGVLHMRFADEATPASRAKAFGAASLNLYMGVGDSSSPGACRFIGSFTRNPIEIEISQDDDGKCATFYACWSSPRGETGPWSLPVSMTIAA